MSLFELAYISTAAHDFSASDLEELLIAARSRNEFEDITGVLMYNGVNFAQFLEGSRDSIDRVFSSIQVDDRHTGVIKIIDREISQRSFSSWRLANLTGSGDIFAANSPFAKAVRGTGASADDSLITAVDQLKAQIFEELRTARTG